MTSPRSVSSAVTVSVSPQSAFTAFTDEMDLWWVRGPINFYDSARAVKMICEPGVGGRILEVYGSDLDDALELARITAWEPGQVLAWHSSVDDVEVEVTFVPTAGGTAVQVLATVPAGGQDRGGTAWQRVVPDWFGAWCARISTGSRSPCTTSSRSQPPAGWRTPSASHRRAACPYLSPGATWTPSAPGWNSGSGTAR